MSHVSRIPLARPSAVNVAAYDEPTQGRSRLPRSTANEARRPAVRPLSETNGKSVGNTSYRQHEEICDSAVRGPKGSIPRSHPDESETENIPPVSDVASLASVSAGEHVAAHLLASDGEAREHRRHRQSLSQRTAETLSRISPAPSPARRQSTTSTTRSDYMGPPPLPTSMRRKCGPTTPSKSASSSVRPVSPVKLPFRPPGSNTSSIEQEPVAPSMESIYTPPRAFLRGARTAGTAETRPNKDRAISIAQIVPTSRKQAPSAGRQPIKMKSMHSLRPAVGGRTLASKPSLESVTSDHYTPLSENRVSVPSTRLRAPSANLSARVKGMPKPTRPIAEEVDQGSAINSLKSSAALREQITRAKAARRSGLQQSTLSPADGPVGFGSCETTNSRPGVEIDRRSLTYKVNNAVTSGVLNLAALSLTHIPHEVVTMYDFQEDSTISWAEAVDLRKLLIADNELEELPGILFTDWSPQEMECDSSKSNQLAGLEVLDIHGNQLSTLPIGLRRLQNLHLLNLNRNRIDFACFDVLATLHNLRELRLADNHLDGALPAEIGCLSNLQILDISNNAVSSLPKSLANLHNLQKLLLSSNKLRHLDLACIPFQALLLLDVSRNLLSGTLAGTLNQFTRLQALDLSSNSLQELCLSELALPVLHTLSLDRNRVTSLPDLTLCEQLVTLTASENRLSTWPTNFGGSSQLRSIDLSFNHIKKVDDSVVDMQNLVMLNLAGNPLREKRYLTMNVADIKADVQTKATVSSADFPRPAAGETSGAFRIASIFTPHAGVLDLSSRDLTQLDPEQVDLSEPVHTIRLANNRLTSFPIKVLTHPQVQHTLKSLDLSHNQHIHSTDYLTSSLHLPALQSLYIVSTGLTTLTGLITHLSAPNLQELNISCHRLSGSLPPLKLHFPTLTTLLASDNWFDSLAVSSISGLEVLDIRNNEIESLPPHIGLLGNRIDQLIQPGRLRVFECAGNKFRVPRLAVVEKGTEAILKDLRRMVPSQDVPEEWIGKV